MISINTFGSPTVEPAQCVKEQCSDEKRRQCKFLSSTVNSMICVLYNSKSNNFTILDNDHRCSRCIKDNS